MHFIWKTAILTICLLMTVVGTPAAEQADKAATVNGTVITVKEIDRELDLLAQRMAQQGRQISEEQLEGARGQVLENLINMELLVQESRKNGIAVDDATVENQFNEYRQRFGTPERFETALKMMDLTESGLKSKIRSNLAVRELISREVEPGVSVSEEEVRMFYEQNLASFQQPEKIRARHILVKVDADTDREKAREKIDAIRTRVAEGEDFASVAEQSSEGPSRSKGGDLGFFGRGQMVKPFEEAAFSLEEGKISPVVETRFGYHVIQVTDRQPEKTLTFEEVEEKLTGILRQEKTKTGTREYIEKLREPADIERF